MTACFNSILPRKTIEGKTGFDVIDKVINLKEKTYDGFLNFQISCNSTDENVRKKRFLSLCIKPNKQETLLNRVLQSNFPKQFEYVGNGKLVIGTKCPDFANFKNKLIIELFGDYWHRGQTGDKRIKYFAKYKYKTLIIWEHELKNREQVIEKIRRFINNEFS